MPGPSDYDVKKILRNSSFATINKAEIVKKPENPIVGPGRYTYKSLFENKIPGTTVFQKEKCFRGKNEISPIRKSINANPGPGSYCPTPL
jgi:hypothetical protein